MGRKIFEECGISHEKPTNAVLASPGIHYERIFRRLESTATL